MRDRVRNKAYIYLNRDKSHRQGAKMITAGMQRITIPAIAMPPIALQSILAHTFTAVPALLGVTLIDAMLTLMYTPSSFSSGGSNLASTMYLSNDFCCQH
jgi:hypothetical protein